MKIKSDIKKIRFQDIGLSTRLTIITSVIVIIAITLISGFIVMKSIETGLEEARKLGFETAEHHSHFVKNKIEAGLDVAGSIATTMESSKSANGSQMTRSQVNRILKRYIEKNKDILGIYVAFEPDAFDNRDEDYANTKGHDESGRFIPYWTRDANGNGTVEPLIDYDKPGAGDYYQIPKKTLKRTVLNPVIYPVQGKDVLMTFLVVPILNASEEFIGIAGVDIGLEQIQDKIGQVKLFQSGYITVFSENNTVVASKKRSYMGKPVEETMDSIEMIEKLKHRNKFTLTRTSRTLGKDIRAYTVPTPFKGTSSVWMTTANVIEDEILQKTNDLIFSIILLGSISTFVIIWIVYIVTKNAIKPLEITQRVAQSLINGDFTQRTHLRTKDEIGQIAAIIDKVPEIIENLYQQIDTMITEITYGKLKTRGDTAGFRGSFADIIDGCNVMADVFVNIINAIPIPSIIIDTDYNLRFASKTAEDMFNFKLTDGIDEKCYEYLDSPICQSASCICKQSIQNKAVNSCETAIEVMGKEMNISLCSSPLTDRKGNVVACFEIAFDQTEIKKAQQISEKVNSYQNREIRALSTTLEQMALGDLTTVYNATPSDDKDLAHVSKSFSEIDLTLRRTLQNLSSNVMGIQENSQTVASASEELSAISNQLSSSSEEMSIQAGNVASATEQLSTNINGMASAIEELSVNTNSVSSSATEMSQTMNATAKTVREMNQSVNDVSDAAGKAKETSGNATRMSFEATETMNMLGDAATEIGKVTDVIKRIAEQTNLLALNATIEAASAGDAGKGFAVVANEIKDLANQSSQAADDIADKIEGVQGNSSEAIKVIQNITGVISNIDDAINTIMESVGKQKNATADISDRIKEADEGTNVIATSIKEIAAGSTDMSKSAAEASQAANDISSNIHGVSTAAKQSNQGNIQIRDSAGNMTMIASDLESMVKNFKVTHDD